MLYIFKYNKYLFNLIKYYIYQTLLYIEISK